MLYQFRSLKEQVALFASASSGIGKAAAMAFVEEGQK